MPGVYIPQGQTGFGQGQAVYIRGGDYDQTGFEYDGVPVNRAYDNYAGHSLTTLGQQELQVFTGGTPASASSTGLSGYINQVIRTGTYPGFKTLRADFGGPAFYHGLALELGGASPNRNVSYYFGALGANQAFRFGDQFNGGSANDGIIDRRTTAGGFPCVDGASPYAANPDGSLTLPSGARLSADPGCYTLIPTRLATSSFVTDREFVANLHVAIPRRNGDRDDVQLLVNAAAVGNQIYSSLADTGLANVQNGFGTTALPYSDSYQWPAGTGFGSPVTAATQPVPYYFANSAAGRPMFAPLAPDRRDATNNDGNIVKAQYQRNFGTSAYLRAFGYTFYSDWLQSGPVSAATGGLDGANTDYEVTAHTHGYELQFADQLDPKNLLTLTANLTSSKTQRLNNAQDTLSLATPQTNLLDASGNCYGKAGALAACNAAAARGTFGNPAPYAAVGAAAAAGARWVLTETGRNGALNAVRPTFTSYSITDEFRPSARLTLNLGLRSEQFRYDLASTQNPGIDFWFARAQKEYCVDATTFIVASRSHLGACPAGQFHPDGVQGPAYSNRYDPRVANSVLSPRFAFTYALDPETVLRGSAGKYSQPISSAFTQYSRLEDNVAAYDARFIPFGFFSPKHDARPQVSNSYDFSLEKRLHGTDIALRVTPYLRLTNDQVLNVPLDPRIPFVTGLNVGRQISKGIELALNKGDFNRDGWAAQLSYTHNKSLIHYSDSFAGGRNLIDTVNDQIKGFNAFTQAGGGAPCYSAAGDGSAAPCTDPSAIRNPYYGIARQSLLDRGGFSEPFSTFPSSFFFASISNDTPDVFNAVVQWKKGRLALQPSLQYNTGSPYGAPLNIVGIDPTTCTANQAAIPTAVAAGRGQFADYTSCGGTVLVPNPENGNRFDGIGQYREPSFLDLNLTASYDLNRRTRAQLVLSNLYQACFGGSRAPWAQGGSSACTYSTTPGYVSNFYNGASPADAAANGVPVAPLFRHPYTNVVYKIPFNAYLRLSVKL